MRCYAAYNLTLQSELSLPELPASGGAPDVVIRVGPIQEIPTEFDETGHGFLATGPDEAIHRFKGVGTFRVSGGREITVDPAPDANPTLLRLSVLGPALGLALHQRGYLVLHASAVLVKGRAVAIMGWRGWGKSTLAAVLHGRGHAVISDDVTAVDLGRDPQAVLPGVPQVRLWPDAVAAMGDEPEHLPRLHPDFDKRALAVADGFPAGPVPLERLYVLAAGPHLAIDEVRPAEAVLELIRHWYCARFGGQLLRLGDTAAVHLRQCGQLAEGVPLRRLSRPRLTWSAESLADLVEADLAP